MGHSRYNSYVNESAEQQFPLDLLTILHRAHAAENEIEAKLNAVGLSFAKLLALKALADAGEPIPLGQLAERLSCVKSNITQLIDRLEADGFVARKPDPHDRRTKLAVLTAAGKRACQEGTRVQRETERDVLSRLSRDEIQQLHGLMAKMDKPAG
jgi:DNA-binding MarR family transcriptional regulator